MNYSNNSLRLGSSIAKSPARDLTETVLSLETDKRGTHLRVRKTSATANQARRLLVAAAAALLTASAAQAAISVYQPDAWTRTNSSNTSFFGWDVVESSGITMPFGTTALDDSTADVGFSIGTGVTGLNARIFQGTGIAGGYGGYGHRSSSGNYYSGFNATDFMDDSITALSPGTSGGFTTIVLQLASSAGTANAGLAFAISGATFTLQKALYGTASDGTGYYWYEWTAPGANLNYKIDLDSTTSSVAVDSFTVDTHWTNGASPSVNSIQAVPEPTSTALLGGFGLLALARRRHASRRALA